MKHSLFTLTIFVFLFSCQKSDNGNGNSTFTSVPAPPIDLTVNAISSVNINLSWTDKSTNEDIFKIQRKTGTEIFTDIATVGKNETNYSDKGLSPNTMYVYRVYAYNAVGGLEFIWLKLLYT